MSLLPCSESLLALLNRAVESVPQAEVLWVRPVFPLSLSFCSSTDHLFSLTAHGRQGVLARWRCRRSPSDPFPRLRSQPRQRGDLVGGDKARGGERTD